MAKRRKKQSSDPRPGMGWLGLALVALAAALVGYFLQDAVGVRFRGVGAVIWGGTVLLGFMFGLLTFSQYVLALPGREGWSEGLSILWQYYVKQASQFATPGHGTKGGKRPVTTGPPPPPIPASFKEVGAGMVASHQALAVTRSGKFQRAAGPGFVRLFQKESALQLVDLRPHVRQHEVRATTRDGIPVTTQATVTFWVRRDPAGAAAAETSDEPEAANPFPYDPDAIFQVTYAGTIDQERQPRPWTEQLAPLAAAMLVSELSRYTLDELILAHSGSANPLEDIKAHVRRQLARHQASQGLEVLSVGVGRLSLPADVRAQRLLNWQARWEKEGTVRQAAGDAEVMRRLKEARARVQVEIIDSIARSIETMRRAGNADLSDIVTLRMIEVLEEAMTEGRIEAVMPTQVVTELLTDISAEMRSLIGLPAPVEPDDDDAP